MTGARAEPKALPGRSVGWAAGHHTRDPQLPPCPFPVPSVSSFVRCAFFGGWLGETAQPGDEHGEIAATVACILGMFVVERRLGTVRVECGFQLSREPDTVRAPDVAFIAQERLIRPRPEGYYPGAPDVAVEILSPGDTFREAQEHIEAWLSAGAKSVWLVDPDRCRVMVYAHPHRPQVFEAAETLSDPAIPGFSVRVADLFPEA